MSSIFRPAMHPCPDCGLRTLRWALNPTNHPSIVRRLFCHCGWRGSRGDIAKAEKAARAVA